MVDQYRLFSLPLCEHGSDHDGNAKTADNEVTKCQVEYEAVIRGSHLGGLDRYR